MNAPDRPALKPVPIRAYERLRYELLRAGAYFKKDVETDFVGGELTCISFGGLHQRSAMPRYEFKRTLGHLNLNRVFLRDPHAMWYLRGLRGVHGGVDGACAMLQGIVDGFGVPAFAIGSSMGGYGAILYASRMKLAGALTFSPQTFVDQATRERYGDDRWQREVTRLYRLTRTAPDLRNELIASPLRLAIWFGNEDRLDLLHAQRIADLPGVSLHPVPGPHGIAKPMREQGLLPETIERFVAELKASAGTAGRPL